MSGADRTHIEIVEVGLRDGLQSVAQFVPTAQKTELLRALHAAGVRRAEITSFVSSTAIPQLADAAEVLAFAQSLLGFDGHVLIPTQRQAERAFSAGAKHVAFVLSVSDWHNRSNVRRSPMESAHEFARIAAMAPNGTRIRVNLATAFDCPHDGLIEPQAAMALMEQLVPHALHMEIALCDTTGRANPRQVAQLVAAAREHFPSVTAWAFHGHDTYGLGAANALAAWQAGASAIDASFAGLGGCPFAPGATGNVATEDVVWMFEQMGIDTGIDLTALLAVASQVTQLLPQAQIGGRVRQAMQARQRLAP